MAFKHKSLVVVSMLSLVPALSTATIVHAATVSSQGGISGPSEPVLDPNREVDIEGLGGGLENVTLEVLKDEGISLVSDVAGCVFTEYGPPNANGAGVCTVVFEWNDPLAGDVQGKSIHEGAIPGSEITIDRCKTICQSYCNALGQPLCHEP